jgi:type I restriction enzyme S subunit
MESMKNDVGMRWEMVRLSSIAEVIAGQSPESKYYNDKGYGIPFFQGKADFRIDYPIVRYWCTQPTKIAKPMDILMSVRAPVGPTNICDVEACIGRGLAAIRTSDKLNYKYLYFYFKSIEEKIASQGNGSTFSAITTSVLKELQIPLPPLPIQKRIAEILDAADALKRKDQELLKKYDELAQAIFIDMFGDPVRNEKGWEVKSIGEVCHYVKDGPHVSPKYTSTGIPFISVNNIIKGSIDLSNCKFISQEDFEVYSKKGRPERNDILYTKGGTTGFAKRVDVDYDFVQWVHVALLKFNQTRLNSLFFEYMLNSSFCYHQSQLLTKGIANRDLVLGEIKKIKILFPPIKLQQDFEAKVLLTERGICDVAQSEKNCENLFQALTQKAFKGELVA